MRALGALVRLGMVVLLVQMLASCGADGSRASVPTAPSLPTPPASVAAGRPFWPPGAFDPNVTLAGEVFEIVQGREVPVEGAWVYCELCTEETHAGMYTDNKGAYAFAGVWDKFFWISVTKPGYQDPRGPTKTGLPDGHVRRDVTINGDTRFNVELARK